jgi:hypothetical protein
MVLVALAAHEWTSRSQKCPFKYNRAHLEFLSEVVAFRKVWAIEFRNHLMAELLHIRVDIPIARLSDPEAMT